MPKFYDVSLPIKEGMIDYPKNPETSIRRYASIPEARTNESLITLWSHTGTHVDLSGISEGEYTFIGLPLRIDIDGSPARVILAQD